MYPRDGVRKRMSPEVGAPLSLVFPPGRRRRRRRRKVWEKEGVVVEKEVIYSKLTHSE